MTFRLAGEIGSRLAAFAAVSAFDGINAVPARSRRNRWLRCWWPVPPIRWCHMPAGGAFSQQKIAQAACLESSKWRHSGAGATACPVSPWSPVAAPRSGRPDPRHPAAVGRRFCCAAGGTDAHRAGRPYRAKHCTARPARPSDAGRAAERRFRGRRRSFTVFPRQARRSSPVKSAGGGEPKLSVHCRYSARILVLTTSLPVSASVTTMAYSSGFELFCRHCQPV